ncbi:MAG: FHA domain-containing protein [Verrucomicrobia bacterium]|nr:FHA domain-containing protein [Verrucomicrobiota bacterium]MBU1736256.1 FHA domain-containing protein [Verrucomicrobiota bacterium]MBU1857654.1 FHA domain-containing protein [Verrucomicrobiota bacterium]
MAYLMGMSGSVKGQKFEIRKDRMTIGRNQINDVVLADEAVSSQHCYVTRRGERYVLHDLNSTNGTLLNFERITDEAELKSKHMIQIGSCEFMFNGDSEEGAGASTASVTQVVVDVGRPVINPTFFESVSPFGTRRKSNRNLWLVVFVVIGLAALASLLVFLVQIVK